MKNSIADLKNLWRATGRMRLYRQDRGFGFVVVPGLERDVFVHGSVFEACGVKVPPLGADVTLEYQETTRGLQTTNIVRVEAPERPSPPGGEVYPARVKFYDAEKGFGFANLFG